MMYKKDFILSEATYLLNHSVGRPLKQSKQVLYDSFLTPWEEANEQLWPIWLNIIDEFRAALGLLFNVAKDGFCPQANVSGGLSKLVMSLDRLQKDRGLVLMSEIDFPTVGFVLQKALPNGQDQIRFIPKENDVTDINMWADYLTPEIDAVFISQAYSNTGQKAPLADILQLTTKHNILSIIDVAQSAGIIPLDLSHYPPDFLVGSCLKWLCGGPGAGYLWVNPEQIDHCYPKDVGWFSHERPFEFNIHDFRYHPSALKFWGGTPSIVPYAMAAHSIKYFAQIGSATLRQHNQHLIDMVAAELGSEFVSPREIAQRNGTMVLHFGDQQASIVAALQKADIQVDERVLGMRISPHIYSDAADIAYLLNTIKANYRSTI